MRTAQPALACRGALEPDLDESGFTLVEFMIAAALTSLVLGSTVMLATQIQQAYGTQLDDATVEQEARYALDWIARDLRSAGSDPYGIILDEQEIVLYPNGGADCDPSISGQQGDSIRVQADINPPDGDILDALENVTIAFDAANFVITRQDSNSLVDATAVVMTEAIFTDLCFTHLNSARAATADSKLVAYVQVQVTAQSRGRNLYTGEFTSSTLATEVRLRTR